MQDKKRERIIRDIYTLRAQIKELEEQEQTLRDELGDLEYGQESVGPFVVKVSPNRRFDAARAKKVLTEKEYETILVQRPDSKIAKARFPEKFEQMQREHAPRLSITIPEDD